MLPVFGSDVILAKHLQTISHSLLMLLLLLLKQEAFEHVLTIAEDELAWPYMSAMTGELNTT